MHKQLQVDVKIWFYSLRDACNVRENTKEEGTLSVAAEVKGNWSIITTSNALNFCTGPLLFRKS